jgi:transcriptional regulator with XRE-family HTH domain
MNLQTWRKERDMTQAAAADFLGIPQPTISRIERGEIFPGPETLTLLAEKSDGAISPDDIHETWKTGQARSGAAA